MKKKCRKNEKYLSKCFVINSKSYTFAPLLRTMKAFGRLAQLVQSICLTSRGSAVRIRQRPQKKLEAFTLEHSILSFRAFSSAGSEHLPYKQRVGGSNPSTPTKNEETYMRSLFCLYIFVVKKRGEVGFTNLSLYKNEYLFNLPVQGYCHIPSQLVLQVRCLRATTLRPCLSLPL